MRLATNAGGMTDGPTWISSGCTRGWGSVDTMTQARKAATRDPVTTRMATAYRPLGGDEVRRMGSISSCTGDSPDDGTR